MKIKIIDLKFKDIKQFERLKQLDPEAFIDVNQAVAYQLILENNIKG